jgi:hypothetical protein
VPKPTPGSLTDPLPGPARGRVALTSAIAPFLRRAAVGVVIVGVPVAVLVAVAVLLTRGDAPSDDPGRAAAERIDSLSAEVRAWPDSAQLHATLAFALLRTERRDDAGPHLRAAARLAPDDSTVQGFAARGLADLALWDETFAIADRWVGEKPLSAPWWAMRGASAFYTNRMDVARESYRRVQELDSTFVPRFRKHAEVVAELKETR